MKGIMRWSYLAPVIALACTPLNSFTPAGAERFGPTEAGIEVLEDPPARPYLVIGYAECKGASLSDAMPYLVKQAKANGGDALLKIQSTAVYLQVSTYRAAVIRYTNGSTTTEARPVQVD